MKKSTLLELITHQLKKMEEKIMSQLDDLQAGMDALGTEIVTLASDFDAAFTALQAQLQAAIAGGGKPADLTPALTKLGAINTDIQALDSKINADNPAKVPTITSPTSASGTVGTAFTYQIAGDKNPTSFDASGLPTGLTVDTATGIISGTPTVAGVSTITVKATNASGSGVGTLTLTVA